MTAEAFIRTVNESTTPITMRMSKSFFGENLHNIVVFKAGHYWKEVFTYSTRELETRWDEIEREIRGRVRIVFHEEI